MASPVHDPIEAAAEARVGSTLKQKWRLDKLIGIGGMAAVYAATHRNQKRVAIKVLHAHLCTNVTVRERFLREGYAANSVNHPNAVSVHDDDVTDDGCSFLVMDLLEGETLEARWKRHGKRLPVEEVLCCAEHVLDALVAAHAKGIIHRDLKPENLFLTDSGMVKIVDFGIARLHDLGPSRTRSGSTLGTPGFMAPEQALGRNEDVDAQSDLWSVGATMFTLLSGRHVHDGNTANELLIRAATRRAVSLTTLLPELPRSVTTLVDRALAYDKAARFRDAAAMRSAVRRALVELDAESSSPSHAELSSARARRQRETLLLPNDGLLAAAAGVVLLVSVTFAHLSTPPQSASVARASTTSALAAAPVRSPAPRSEPEVVPIAGNPAERPVSVDELPLAPPEVAPPERPRVVVARRPAVATNIAAAPIAAEPPTASFSLASGAGAPLDDDVREIALIENPYHQRFGSGLDSPPPAPEGQPRPAAPEGEPVTPVRRRAGPAGRIDPGF